MISLLVASLIASPPSVPLQEKPLSWRDFQTLARREIPYGKRLSVLILSEGFRPQDQASFFERAAKFEQQLFSMEPYASTRELWQVERVFVPSRGLVDGQGAGVLAMKADPRGRGWILQTNVSEETSRRVFQILRNSKVNKTKNGAVYDHLFVQVLINTSAGGASGFAKRLTDPESKEEVSAAFGEGAVHEFNHAFARLRDEYIHESGVDKTTPEVTPPDDLWFVSNLISTKKANAVPWAFLFPGSELNPDKESVIGRLWEGGWNEYGSYRAEPVCLMNGTHMNWSLDRTKRQANLRNENRLCFWCEDIVAAKALSLAGIFGDRDGKSLWKEWLKYRPFYQKATRLKDRIVVANREYARFNLAKSPLVKLAEE